MTFNARHTAAEHPLGDKMNKSKFMKSGHFPTLIAAFLYFDVSFMVWVLLGPLAPFLSQQFQLTPYQKGLLTAIPLLGGAFFRPVLGVLGERFGERRTGLLGLTLTLVPLILGWRFAHTPNAPLFSRFLAWHCRCEFRRGATDCGTLVSA